MVDISKLVVCLPLLKKYKLVNWDDESRLVVYLPLLEKKKFVNWDDELPNL